MLVVQKRLAQTLSSMMSENVCGINPLFIDSYNKRWDKLVGTLLADKQDCGRSHYYIAEIKSFNNMNYKEEQQLVNIRKFILQNGGGYNASLETREDIITAIHKIGYPIDFIANDPDTFSMKQIQILTIKRREIEKLLSEDKDNEALVLELKMFPIVRIRKLTPRECFRLMDVPEPYIDKLLSVAKKYRKGEEVLEQILANSSLYHCAGNSIVVANLFHIFRTLLIEKTDGEKAKAFTTKKIQLDLFEEFGL